MARNALRGDGLLIAQNVLQALAADPERIEHERERFDRTPPPPYSPPSGDTTRLPSPHPESEQERLARLRWEFENERHASGPSDQFRAQHQREEMWLRKIRRLGLIPRLPGGDFHECALRNVRADWKKQGIWDDDWHERAPAGLWKHETDAALEGEDMNGQSVMLAGTLRSECVTEQRRQHQASRPYHQFIHRLSKEALRLQKVEGVSYDLYSKAYDIVKGQWIEDKIWDDRWTILPGRFWKHELPFNEEYAKRCSGSSAHPDMHEDDADDGAFSPTPLLWTSEPKESQTSKPQDEGYGFGGFCSLRRQENVMQSQTQGQSGGLFTFGQQENIVHSPKPSPHPPDSATPETLNAPRGSSQNTALSTIREENSFSGSRSDDRRNQSSNAPSATRASKASGQPKAARQLKATKRSKRPKAEPKASY